MQRVDRGSHRDGGKPNWDSPCGDAEGLRSEASLGLTLPSSQCLFTEGHWYVCQATTQGSLAKAQLAPRSDRETSGNTR